LIYVSRSNWKRRERSHRQSRCRCSSFKKSLGHALNEEEQELLDADLPSQQDTQHFFNLINGLHYDKDYILICVCNSGRRSLHAAQLLRALGYRRGFSLHGGYRELKAAAG
jgi:Rhodanese-related sulfurtransferase